MWSSVSYKPNLVSLMNSLFGFGFVLWAVHEGFDPGGAFLLSFTEVTNQDQELLWDAGMKLSLE